MKYKSNRAFTLIELLVVISIIAVLMSILMPALGKVKEQARKVVCGTQLKQQGIGLAAYASDYNRYPHTPFTFNWAYGPMCWNETNNGPLADSDPSQRLPAGQAALIAGSYIEDPSFFYCPSVTSSMSSQYESFSYEDTYLPYSESLGDNMGWHRLFVGYPYWVGYKTGNGAFDKYLDKDAAQKHTDRSDKITITDAITTEDIGGYPATFDGIEMNPYRANHVVGGELKGGNLLFNDGSVKWENFSDMQEDYDRRLRCIRGSSAADSTLFWF